MEGRDANESLSEELFLDRSDYDVLKSLSSAIRIPALARGIVKTVCVDDIEVEEEVEAEASESVGGNNSSRSADFGSKEKESTRRCSQEPNVPTKRGDGPLQRLGSGSATKGQAVADRQGQKHTIQKRQVRSARPGTSSSRSTTASAPQGFMQHASSTKPGALRSTAAPKPSATEISAKRISAGGTRISLQTKNTDDSESDASDSDVAEVDTDNEIEEEDGLDDDEE